MTDPTNPPKFTFNVSNKPPVVPETITSVTAPPHGEKHEPLTLDTLNQHHTDYVRNLGTQTGVGIGNNSGVLRSLFSGLQDDGFTMTVILSKLFVIMDFLQQYGGDIARIVNAFNQLFGSLKGQK